MSDDDKSGSDVDSEEDVHENPDKDEKDPHEQGGKEDHAKQKQSFGMSVKKWAMSRTATTKMGRRAIGHFLGEQGLEIVNIIKSVVQKDQGENKAREVKRRIFKLALKAKLLVDDKKLKETDVEHLVDPLHHILLNFHQRLRISVATDQARAKNQGGTSAAQSTTTTTTTTSTTTTTTSTEKDTKEESGRAQSVIVSSTAPDIARTRALSHRSFSVTLDIGLLVSNFARIQHFVVDLLAPHISEKNLSKLRGLMSYLGSKQLLSALFNDPRYEKDRAGLCESVGLLMQQVYDELAVRSSPLMRRGVAPGRTNAQGSVQGGLRIFGADVQLPDQCQAPNCKEKTLPKTPSFPGSKFCALHFEEQYQNLLANPSVLHFLVEDGTECTAFFKFEALQPLAPAIRFYQASVRYKLVTQGIRRIFGEELFEKYLNVKSPHNVVGLVGESVVGRVASELGRHKEQRTVPPDTLFEDAMANVLQHLEQAFHEKFVRSEEFKKYIAERHLDEHV